MKKIYLLAVIIIVAIGVNAQYYYLPYLDAGQNPGNLNKHKEYPQGGGLSGGWTAILPGIPSSNVWSSITAIPFDFEFNGKKVTHFKASNTGVVTFDTGYVNVPSRDNGAIPSANIPDNSLLLWGLFPAVNPTLKDFPDVLVRSFGKAPNRQFYIFYNTYVDSGIGNGWGFWSIVLEETTNNIYFVDQRTYNLQGTTRVLSLTVGIQIDSKTAFQVSGSPNLGSVTSGSAENTDNAYYQFIYGTHPKYDVAMKDLYLNQFYLKSEAPFALEGTMQNYGSEIINSLDLNYSVNGGATVTDKKTGLSIDVFDKYDFEIPTKWNPTAIGDYEIEVWASNINSNADMVHHNDSIRKSTIVAEKAVERIPLHEVFTSSTCGPCVGGNVRLSEVLENYDPDENTVIKYQMSWPGSGDPYFTSEGQVRREYYGISGVPNLEVDGQWNKNPSGYTDSIYDIYKKVHSYIELDAIYEVEEQTVSVDIDIKSLENYNVNDLRLYAGIVENITYQNVGTNGEDEFEFVMKKMMPTANGVKISLTKDKEVNKSYNWRFRGDYRLPDDASDPIQHSKEHSVEDFDNLSVVVWIQNYNTWEVYQSAWAVLKSNSLDEDPTSGIISFYPNPVSESSILRYKANEKELLDIQVINLTGQIILSDKKLVNSGINSLEMPLGTLKPGGYIIKVNTNTKVYSKHFIKL